MNFKLLAAGVIGATLALSGCVTSETKPIPKIQAKQAVGEKVDASSREKLLRTISQTAPKVMEQYKSSGVDFTVVVKDNQVVIKAKPKG